MNNWSSFISFILVLVWTYTGFDKILHWESSWRAFHNQTFPPELAGILSFAVPGIELLIALLLLFSCTRWWGFLSSILLLTVFTTYVGLIWVGAFPRIPCNCAGIIESMGWSAHFYLNLVLLLFGIVGLVLTKKRQETRLPI